jgi:Ca2+-binding EF-hand superfamily protein
MKTIAARAFAVLDTDSDGALSAAELIPVTGTSDGAASA